jgi:CHAT domain-containing protein
VSLTLVAERQSQDTHLQTIPEVEREIQGVSMVAKDNDIRVSYEQSGSTTVEDTSTAMTRANIVHLACHGVQDDADATKSGFCLGDGRLTISHLMNLHIEDGFLAFLSACETAKGSKAQPDQAMHLAAAMLFVGFKTVIATMW